jgi:CDP-glycerol glycerophosphotransferase (TagB/SpsB family)
MKAGPRLDRVRAAIAARVARLMLGRSTPRDLVVILAGSVIGNLAALARELRVRHPDVEVAYLLTRRSGPLPDHSGRVLRPWRLRDLSDVARARVIVTAQGPWSLRSWITARRRPLFVDVWHGVGYKSRIATSHPAFRSYDAHFVPSPFVADFYAAAGARAIVTGYGRMDAIVTKSTDPSARAVLEEQFPDATGPVVLFAPTWGIESTIDDASALAAIERATSGRSARIVYRPHFLAPAVDVRPLPHVRKIGQDLIPNADDLLPHVDILITDWSSIAMDYLPLERPVLFIEAEPPARPLGPLTEDDRPGPVVTTPDELAAEVGAAVLDPSAHLRRYETQRSNTVVRAWGETLDGSSSARYIAAIHDLESERREKAKR